MPARGLAAFYTYSAACGIFSCIATGLYMPLLLEQLARRHGVVESGRDRACEEGERCSVLIMGLWVDSASYSLYTKSINVALQAITLISISVLADIPRWRNKLIISFALTGSILASAFLVLPTTQHFTLYVAALLVIVPSVCMSDSYVCLNAMLPSLARSYSSGDNQQETQSLISTPTTDALRSSLDLSDLTVAAPPVPSTSLSNISSRGIGIGFLSGVTGLCISLIPVSLAHGSLSALKGVIGAAGVTWLALTMVVWGFLPALEAHDGEPNVRHKVYEGWMRVRALFDGEEIRKLRVTYWYLLTSALLQDAFNTITATSILFARTTLAMQPSRVLLIGLVMQLTAACSAFLTPFIQRRYGISGIQGILGCVGMALGMCLWGLVGLRTQGEMYACAVWFGLLYGPYDSLARSVLVEFIPKGHEARFFSLFSITDKSASFLGPAAIALVTDVTGEMRYAFAVLAVLLAAPVPVLLWRVDEERGRQDARAYGG